MLCANCSPELTYESFNHNLRPFTPTYICDPGNQTQFLSLNKIKKVGEEMGGTRYTSTLLT
jgi:hypothetical protein